MKKEVEEKVDATCTQGRKPHTVRVKACGGIDCRAPLQRDAQNTLGTKGTLE